MERTVYLGFCNILKVFKVFFCLKIIFLLLIPYGLLGQAQSSKSVETITIDPPSQVFNPIMIQAYKGLPRLGAQDSYYKIQKYYGKGKILKSIDPELEKLRYHQKKGYRQFLYMLQLSGLTPTFNDLNREEPTTERDSPEKENSYRLQHLFRKMLINSCTEEDCKKTFRHVNQFEQRRAYKNFTTKYWPSLKEWTNNDSFKNGFEAYFIQKTGLGVYDFDKGGYWVSFKLNGESRGDILLKTWRPLTDFDKALSDRLGNLLRLTLFLPVSEKQAEELEKRKTRVIYLTRKISVGYQTDLKKVERAPYVYGHTSPDIDIFLDEALTEKLGSISLQNYTPKK